MTRATIIQIEFVDLDLVNESDIEHNPEVMFQRKVEALAELLDCSEEEATRIILHYL